MVAASLALAAIFLVPLRRSVAGLPIAALCLAAAFWSIGAAWAASTTQVNPGANAMILAGVSWAAAAAYVAARRLVSGNWPIPLPIATAFIVEPILIVLARAVWLRDLTSAEFRGSLPFVVHAAYCFALLLGVILTLNARQRDPVRRVRIFVLISQVQVISIIALEVAASEQTQFLVVLSGLFAVWVARHPNDWSTSAARADSLLNSIGVFLFVFDRHGQLRDWNGNADRLVELITGDRPNRELTSTQILGRTLPFEDGEQIDLEFSGGRMRTSAHIHQVDPTSRSRRSDWVVMLRPVRSSVNQSSFPSISGELTGYDPATQTLNRRGVIELLRAAADTGDAVVRVDVLPSDRSARDDVTMFVLARRLESMFPSTQWGRLATWAFVGVFDVSAGHAATQLIDVETPTSLGLAATVSAAVCIPSAGEDPPDFVQRVAALRPSTG